jgi:hypothetical protein
VTGANGDLAPKTHASFGFDALNCYLGIGTPTPSYTLHVAKSFTNSYGSTAKLTNVSNLTTNFSLYNTVLEIDATGTSVSGGVVDSGYKTGLQISNYAVGYAFAGTISGLLGLRSLVGIGADATAGAVVTNAYGAQILSYNLTAGTTVTNSYGVFIDSRNSAVGTITNAWDVYASNAIAYNYFAGYVGIGGNVPTCKLELFGPGDATSTTLLKLTKINGYGTTSFIQTYTASGFYPYGLEIYDGTSTRFGIYGSANASHVNWVYTDSEVYIGTLDIDGTPATGKLTVQGAGTDVNYNIFVGRNSNGANVTTLDCAGYLTCSGGVRSDAGYGFGAAPTAGVGLYAYSASSIEIIRGKVGADAPGAIHWTADQCFTFVDGTGPYTRASFDLSTGIFSIYLGLTLGFDAAGGGNNTPGSIKFISAGDNAYYNTFTSGINTANATYTWPLAMPTSSGYVLSCTDAGVMSWAAAPAAATMTVVADTTDQTCYPLFVNGATGDLAVKTHAAFGFDALNGWLGVGIATPSTRIHVVEASTTVDKTAATIALTTVLTDTATVYNSGLLVDISGLTLATTKTDSGIRTGLHVAALATGAGFAGTQNYIIGQRVYSGIGASCTSGAVVNYAYGGYFCCQNDSASTTLTTSIAVYANSKNGTTGTITNAWDFYGASATSYNYFAGNVGIGVQSPGYALSVSVSKTQASVTAANIILATSCTADIGLVNTVLNLDMSSLSITSGVTDGNSRTGFMVTGVGEGAGFLGTQSYMFGSRSYVGIGSTAGATAAVLNCYGGGFYCQNQKAGTTITNAYAVYANSKNVATGTITNAWDFYGASATSYNYFAGSVGIGTATPSAAKVHILKASGDYTLPAMLVSGKSVYNTGDDAYGFAYYLLYNLTGNRQLGLCDTESNSGVRFMLNYIDGYNTVSGRMDLNLGSDTNGVHVGTTLGNTQFSASNYNGTATKIVCEIYGAHDQSGNYLNVSSFHNPNTGDILSVAATGNMFLGTTDVDGTPPIGRLVVQGSTNDGTTNIFVGRDSDGANVATLDTDGNLVLVPFTGITRTGKLDVNNTNSSTVVVRGVSATWQATTVDISKIEFSSWVLDSGSVTSGRISTRLNDPGNTFASDLLLWATPVAGTPVEYVRLKSTGNLLVGYSAETSPVSRLVVKGSTNNASTNIFTGLDSDDATQFVINTDGQVTTGSWHATTLAYDHGGTGLTAYPKKTIILPAAAAALGTTTPATRETREIGTTARPVVDVLKFAHAAISFAWWKFILPDSYDGGTITAKISYTNIATDSTNKFLFTISAACLADGGPLDVTMGTAVELEATVADTAEDVKIASWGTAITPSGTPAGGQVIIIKLQRDPADTDHDTTSLDAYVLDLAIEYTTNSWTD